MKIEFINGFPSVYIKEINAVVIGDVHIGKELSLSKIGVQFINATEVMAENAAMLCRIKNAKKLIILGDVKESILYPDKKEYELIKKFFDRLSEFEVFIVKGNHDSHLTEIFEVLNIKVITRYLTCCKTFAFVFYYRCFFLGL